MVIAGLMLFAALTDPDGVVSTAPSDTDSVAAAMAAPAEIPVAAPSAQDATPHGLTTEEQIRRWISARASGESFGESFEEALAAAPEDDRKVHGMVEAGIGTGGYRSYGATVSMPVGENGRLDLSYREGRNEPWYWGAPGYYGPRRWSDYRGYGESRSFGLGFSWSKADDRGD